MYHYDATKYMTVLEGIVQGLALQLIRYCGANCP